MLRISSNHIARIALSAAAFAVCQTTLIAPAHALKLEGLSVKQSGARPEIHVRFDRKADTWTAVTGDNVAFRFDYEITVKAAYALAPGSKISLNVDNLSGEAALQSSNNSYSELHLGHFNLHKAGSALGELKIARCRPARRSARTAANQTRSIASPPFSGLLHGYGPKRQRLRSPRKRHTPSRRPRPISFAIQIPTGANRSNLPPSTCRPTRAPSKSSRCSCSSRPSMGR